jgi:hypothetical protein
MNNLMKKSKRINRNMEIIDYFIVLWILGYIVNNYINLITINSIIA